jgi:hypothetical protein
VPAQEPDVMTALPVEPEHGRGSSGRAAPPAAAVVEAAPQRVTKRAVGIGLLLVLLFAPAAFYSELLFGVTYMFASGVPAMAPLVVLFLLTAAHPLASRLGLRPLTRGELLTIYAITLVGGPLVTHGILGWMLPSAVARRYFGRAFPEWEGAYFQYLPDWLGPSNTAAVEDFFQGHAPVPWGEWAVPLAVWGAVLVALFTATYCLAALFYPQWARHERLSFPLAQVPLTLVQERGRTISAGRLPANWVFWAGLGIPVAIGSVNGVAQLFPSFPSIPLFQVLIPRQVTGPLAGLGDLTMSLSPSLIAIAYLIPSDLSLSCWLFWWLRVGMTVLAISAGATPQSPESWWGSSFPAPYYQGSGTVLVLGVWMVWMGRRHLARSIRTAFGRGAPGEGTDEPISSRWAWLGLLASFAYLALFCWAAGMRPLLGITLVALIITYYLIWARMRAETGMGFLPFPLDLAQLTSLPFGSAIFRPSEVVTLWALRWTYYPGYGESFEVCTGNGLESFRVTGAAGIRLRTIAVALLGSFVLSAVVGIWVVMAGAYHYGFLNLSQASQGWLGPQLPWVGQQTFEMLQNPSRADLNGAVAVVAGAAVTLALAMLRLRFPWWPLHPVGYLAANCWGMHWYWMPFFIGWLGKVLSIRYGGLRLYSRAMPFAIGLLLGDMVNQGIWVVLDIVTGQRG